MIFADLRMYMSEHNNTAFVNENISAVVCTLNEEERIEKCLLSLIKAGVGEIIVVDGKSSDKTVKIAQQYTKNIYFDNGTGLGAARNIGILKSTKEFILNFGADNTIEKNSLQIMLSDLHAFDGVSCLTEKGGNNYLNRSLNIYRKLRYFSGPADVIGTPSIFRRKLLAENLFDSNRKASDDSELCERLWREKNCRFYISETYCNESGTETLNTIRSRWKNLYGCSDFENYEFNKKSWTYFRRIKSILYPLVNELILPVSRIKTVRQVTVIPFLLYITYLRYLGWAKLKYVK